MQCTQCTQCTQHYRKAVVETMADYWHGYWLGSGQGTTGRIKCFALFSLARQVGPSNVLRFSHLPGSPSQAPLVFGFSCEMFVCWRGSFTRTNKVTKSHAQSGLWIQERTAYKYVYHNRDIQHSEQIIIRPNKRKIDQSFLDSLSSKSHAQSGLWIQERTAYKYVKKWNKWRPKGPNKTKNKMQWPYML